MCHFRSVCFREKARFPEEEILWQEEERVDPDGEVFVDLALRRWAEERVNCIMMAVGGKYDYDVGKCGVAGRESTRGQREVIVS